MKDCGRRSAKNQISKKTIEFEGSEGTGVLPAVPGCTALWTGDPESGSEAGSTELSSSLPQVKEVVQEQR